MKRKAIILFIAVGILAAAWTVVEIFRGILWLCYAAGLPM